MGPQKPFILYPSGLRQLALFRLAYSGAIKRLTAFIANTSYMPPTPMRDVVKRVRVGRLSPQTCLDVAFVPLFKLGKAARVLACLHFS